jgi:hypothetical protein
MAAAVLAQDAPTGLRLLQGYGSTAPSGTVLHFRADAPSGAYQKIFLVGEGVNETPRLSAAPYEFSIWVPRNATGIHRFRAIGVDASGQLQFSDPVALNLVPAEQPERITTPVAHLTLQFVGDTARLRVTGHFAGGGKADLTQAPATSFASSDAAVVRVADVGQVIAVGPGAADIRIQSGAAIATVHVTVPATVRGDLNGDGRVDQDDVNLFSDAIGTTVSPADARDLNGDGKIDAADLALLRAICSRAGCQRTAPK